MSRPRAVTAVCVLGALASVYALVLILGTRMWAVPPTLAQRAAGLAAVAVAVASLYGMWRMRRWGVILLGVALAARIVYGLAAGLPWSWSALVGPAAVLAIGVAYVRKMS